MIKSIFGVWGPHFPETVNLRSLSATKLRLSVHDVKHKNFDNIQTIISYVHSDSMLPFSACVSVSNEIINTYVFNIIL